MSVSLKHAVITAASVGFQLQSQPGLVGSKVKAHQPFESEKFGPKSLSSPHGIAAHINKDSQSPTTRRHG